MAAPERSRSLVPVLAAFAMVVSLAACSGKEDQGAPCPQARVLGEPSEMTRYRDGPGRDPTDVLFVARMMKVVGECDYPTKGGPIDVDLEVTMDVLRGPAMTDEAAGFRYFVALTEWTEDATGEPVIHSREAFPVETRIPAGHRGLTYRDVLRIKVPRTDARDVRRYVIYLGFELTMEELSRNRERFGY